MLEILAVIFLSGKIGDLAERKGQKKGKWKAYAILGWFISEIVGIAIGIAMFGSEEFGYSLAILSYFAIRQTLQKMPDVETGFDFEKDQKRP
mgnify:CR=1 FL=1